MGEVRPDELPGYTIDELHAQILECAERDREGHSYEERTLAYKVSALDARCKARDLPGKWKQQAAAEEMPYEGSPLERQHKDAKRITALEAELADLRTAATRVLKSLRGLHDSGWCDEIRLLEGVLLPAKGGSDG